MALFISVDVEPNYRGFLLSYVALRGLLGLMYWRASATSKNGAVLARYLAHQSGTMIKMYLKYKSLAI